MEKRAKSLRTNTENRDTHPPQRSIRLKNAGDINRFLARVINELYRDKISPQKAGKLGFLCNVMLHSIDTQETEKRLDALEEAINSEKTVG